MSDSPRRLQVEFTTEAAFRSEYLANISNGGVFVATSDVFEVRSMVVVDIELGFCEETIALEGEIVHVVTTEMASAGAERGVAVQFTVPTRELRERFEPLVGVVEANERVTKRGRRTAPRAPARVGITVSSDGRPDFETESRDLSASGIAIGADECLIPVGEFIRLGIRHPRTDEEMSIEARVVRHLESKDGGIAAMGLAFEISEARKTEVASFISDVRAVEHSRRLGGISGPIADLGIENLLQMFAAGSPRGTLVVTRRGDQGTIAFEGGKLKMAKVGRHDGLDALREMMTWREGTFEFIAELECDERQALNVSLNAAILEAMCAIDEENRDAAAGVVDDALDFGGDDIDLEDIDLDEDTDIEADLGTQDVVEQEAAQEAEPEIEMRVTGASVFEIDGLAADAMRSELDKTEEAVLDLAAVGMSLDRIVEVIPEPELDVYKALDALQEYGILRPR